MLKFFISFLLLLSFFLRAQENPKKIIDSINKANWEKTYLDLDSLENSKISTIDSKFKDSIIVKDEMIMLAINSEPPLTPYNLKNLKIQKRWFFFGQNNLVFNQASFSNWNSGGNNNIGVLGKINYNLSYRKDKHFLENILQLGYGFLSTKGQSQRKTEDIINFQSNYGYDLGKNYYLSTGFQFLSQFTAGYNYDVTPDPNFSDRISKFLAPAYINAGLGISYNPNENFQIIARPINGKFTLVNDPFLQKAGKYGLEKDGQSLRTELGALLNFIYRLKIMPDVYMDNNLNFFSNYVSHSERVDIAYNSTLNIKFNKFITTVVTLDLMYDHDQIQKLQRKQTLGVGFSYNLGAQNTEKETRKKVIKPFIAK